MFPAIYFTYATKYPASGTRVQLGRSYIYAAPDPAPDQRIFVLTLTGMQYFVTGGGAIDTVTQPGRNMKVLENFYNTHRLHSSFTFNHPILGTLTCKFNRPLEIPVGITGGNGVLEPFEVELIEVP